jgi:hypothetical protein
VRETFSLLADSAFKHLIGTPPLGHRRAQHAPAQPRAAHLFLPRALGHLGKPWTLGFTYNEFLFTMNMNMKKWGGSAIINFLQ